MEEGGVGGVGMDVYVSRVGNCPEGAHSSPQSTAEGM